MTTLLALAGCNQVFSLKPTSQLPAVDARYFDAPADAQAACPADGSPPVFSRTLHQVITQYCDGYTISPAVGLGVARCAAGIAQGPIDHEPTPSTLTWPDGLYTPQTQLPPVLAADGDQMFVLDYDSTDYTYAFAIYQAQSDGSWLGGAMMQLPFAVGGSDVITAPTRRPDRRVLYSRWSYDSTIHELAEDANGTWNDLGVLDTSTLGVANPTLQMTADGLHAIGHGVPATTMADAVLYTSRASLSSPWAQFSTVDTVTTSGLHLFLTEDCDRVYFDALQSVFYVEQ